MQFDLLDRKTIVHRIIVKLIMNLLYAIGIVLLSWSNYFPSYCCAEPIVGGHFDNEEEAIWVVSIQTRVHLEWRHFCGGSLISKRDVITAAHCFVQIACEHPQRGQIYKNRLINLKRKKLKVIIGLNDLLMKGIIPSRGIEKRVKRAFIHVDYEQIGNRVIHDIAVIRLAKPITDADEQINAENKFGFIKLFRPDERNEASNYDFQNQVFGVGYGAIARTAEGKYERDGLRKILKVHFTEDRRSHQFPGLKLVQYKGDAETARGFCNGDSGGPIYFKSDKNEFQLVGLISSGPCDCDMRNSTGKSGKVTFIPDHLDFLETIKNLNDSQIVKETSLSDYQNTGAKYFVLPEHNKIAKLKYFNKTSV